MNFGEALLCLSLFNASPILIVPPYRICLPCPDIVSVFVYERRVGLSLAEFRVYSLLWSGASPSSGGGAYPMPQRLK